MAADTVLDRLRAAALRRRQRRRMPRQPVDLAGPKLVGALADEGGPITFVEIGAHDGAHLDHLRPYVAAPRWRGVMVEPVPHLAERLRATFAEVEGVSFEEAAIGDRCGRATFWHLRPARDADREGLPGWYDEVGSLSKERVVDHASVIPDLERRLVRTEVACLTFQELCRRHAIEAVDLLVIDAEGSDWTIIQGIDFDRHRPRLLSYEHVHLSARDRGRARRRLKRHGYASQEEGFDTWCVHADCGEALQRAWRESQWLVPPIGSGLWR